MLGLERVVSFCLILILEMVGIIGAGAVVTHDVPDNCKALGIPAKIFPIKDSKEDI